MLRINDIAPNFDAVSTEGSINLHQYLSNSWGILFSHPKDFTPVCTTELGYMAKIEKEFKSRNCKLIGLSVDSVEDHHKWKKDIEETQGVEVSYPLIADENLQIAKLYNMLPSDEVNVGAVDAANSKTVLNAMVCEPL